MFTGIVSGIGTLQERHGARLVIAGPFKRGSLDEGASIACDGCCLTIVDVSKAKGSGALVAVEASNETLARTTLGDWQVGRRINLERALAFGDELGGHLVTGHVDGRAKILARDPDGDSVRFVLERAEALSPYIAAKGSVALDGVSLTVNEVDAHPLRRKHHSLHSCPYDMGRPRQGDLVNLEVDLLARYVARLREQEGLNP